MRAALPPCRRPPAGPAARPDVADRSPLVDRGRRRAVFLLAALAGCTRTPPEQQLRDTIARMADAVERRDAAALLAHVADDFTRDDGGLDRRQLRSLLLGIFLRNQRIGVYPAVREVRVDGTRAVVRLGLLATGGSGLLPEQGRTWNLTTGWRRDGDWKVFNARWSD